MRVLKNTVIKKILIILITIIMINNFIMPNYVHAAEKESAGEKLVNALSYLVAWVGDAGIKVMQKIMIGTGDIEELNTTTNENEYAIKYSPGLIFSNSIPALDINFISASESDNDSVSRLTLDVENKDDYIELIKKAKLTVADFTTEWSTTSERQDKIENVEKLSECGISIEWDTPGQYSVYNVVKEYKMPNTSGLFEWTFQNWDILDWRYSDQISDILENKPAWFRNFELCVYIFLLW